MAVEIREISFRMGSFRHHMGSGNRPVAVSTKAMGTAQTTLLTLSGRAHGDAIDRKFIELPKQISFQHLGSDRVGESILSF